MIVYFNGFKMKAKNDLKIAQTKQVNSLFDLATRQSNFTNAIEFERVGANVVAMEMLGVVGNNSTVPYKLNSVSMYSDSGECFIYNGRCVIIETTDVYKVQFLDGNLDLYKAIGNDKLGSLDLSEIKHKRTVVQIITTWFEAHTPPFKYIVADFNGKSITDEGYLNADYLVPSVKASYLWDKIFSKYGFTYSGNFFNTDDFKKLWLTYPSGVEIDEGQSVTIYKSENFFFKRGINAYKSKGAFMRINTSDVNTIGVTDNSLKFTIPESGTYTFRVFGNLYVSALFASEKQANYKISIGKNYSGNITIDTDAMNYSDLIVIAPALKSNADFEFDESVNITLEAGDVIYLMIKQDIYPTWGIADKESRKLGFEIKKVNDDIIDFSKAFQDLETKAFFNEIINRHALVPIKDKYTNNYSFYTLDELLAKKDAYDWSNKFPQFRSEKYLYDSYQQRNYFRHKYDSPDVEYNDGFIQINNSNLEDKTTSYQSPLYSPEALTTQLLGAPANVYKLWNKEIKDDGTVNYKTIDKRFFFISYSMRHLDTPAGLKSEFDGDMTFFNNYPAESFKGLDFSSTVARFYKNSSVLLNKAVVLTLGMMLNDNDISNIDFSRQVYLKQYGSNFLINKISNYTSSKVPTTVELVKIGEVQQDAPPSDVEVITSVSWNRYRVGLVYRARININYVDTFFNTPTVKLRFLDSNQYEGYEWTNDGFLDPVLPSSFIGLTVRFQIYNDSVESEIKTISLT